ncbi:unnamed protein product [Prunus armeniaca]
MTVESTVQLQEIQNLKRKITELEGKETRIDMEKIAKKKKIEEKYKVEIQSLLSDPTIFEMEMDLPTTQPTQPVEEKEEEKKEEEKQQEEKEEEKKNRNCNVLTQETSQRDATNPIPDPLKGMSLHDSIPVGLHNEKVTNHDIKDIVWDLELPQNVIKAYIQIEEEKIGPMQTYSPQYMSTWTWAYMQTFLEPNWHRALYEHLLEKLGKCNVLFFLIISSSEFQFTLLTFHKIERKWRHYNPLRSLGPRKEEKCIDIAQNFVSGMKLS